LFEELNEGPRKNFERTKSYLNPDHLLKSLTFDSIPVSGRLDVPELVFDEAFIYPEQLDPREFGIILIASADPTTGKCPLCRHANSE
jgi:hypothetical protein